MYFILCFVAKLIKKERMGIIMSPSNLIFSDLSLILYIKSRYWRRQTRRLFLTHFKIYVIMNYSVCNFNDPKLETG